MSAYDFDRDRKKQREQREADGAERRKFLEGVVRQFARGKNMTPQHPKLGFVVVPSYDLTVNENRPPWPRRDKDLQRIFTVEKEAVRVARAKTSGPECMVDYLVIPVLYLPALMPDGSHGYLIVHHASPVHDLDDNDHEALLASARAKLTDAEARAIGLPL